MTEFRVADRVGVVVHPDEVYVAHLPDGPILRLDGTAGFIWQAALHGGTEGIVDRVAAAVRLPAAEIAAHVNAFVEALIEQGLLVRGPDAGY